MANTKGSALTTATPAAADYLILVDDPAGTPSTKAATVSDVRNAASASDIRAGTADKLISADGVESAAEEVTLTDAATIAVDWSTFINAKVTLAGNRTLGNPTNGEPGTWRLIRVIQDGTGSRTLTFTNSPQAYKFAGGTAPTLTTTASAVDVLTIYCVDASTFYVFDALDMS